GPPEPCPQLPAFPKAAEHPPPADPGAPGGCLRSGPAPRLPLHGRHGPCPAPPPTPGCPDPQPLPLRAALLRTHLLPRPEPPLLFPRLLPRHRPALRPP